jgi:hypothetical protein
LLLLFLLVASLVLLATAVPKSWVLNFPMMFLMAGCLLLLLEGPLHGLTLPLQKAVKIGISACVLAGIAMLLNWPSLWIVFEPWGLTRNQTGFHLLLVAVCGWWISVFWIIFSRQKERHSIPAMNSPSVNQTRQLARRF